MTGSEMSRMIRAAALAAALLFLALPVLAQQTGKDESQVPPELNSPPTNQPGAGAGASQPPAAGNQQQPGEDLTSPDDNGDATTEDGESSPDEMSLGEIPSIQTVE